MPLTNRLPEDTTETILFQKKVQVTSHCEQVNRSLRVTEKKWGVSVYAIKPTCLMFNQPPSVTNSAKTDAVTGL